MAEQPTVTEPAAEPTQTNEGGSDDILAKLKELDISDPKKLDNMAIASSQAGKLANDLGETRAELAQVKDYLAKMQTTDPQPYDYNEGIDVGSVVRKETRSVIQSIMQEQQESTKKAQEAYFRDMGMVQNDRRYPFLKETFEKHMGNFNTQQKVNTGNTTASAEYQKIKDAYYDILEENQTKLGAAVPATPVPHVESGESHSVPMPSVDEETKTKLKNRVDPTKGFSGTDENMIDLVKDMMGNDSIFT
jgi:hypothetical protein